MNLITKLNVLFLSLSLLLATMLGGCQTVSQENRAVPVQHSEFEFSDGGKALAYALKKQFVTTANDAPVNLLFVIAGSDCISMAPMLPDYFTGFEGESGATQIYMLQKRHIHRYSRGRNCGEAFTNDDHLQQWLSDQREFIQTKIKFHNKATPTPVRVILMGISEGAETATLLAQQLPVSHLVLLAHSGKAPLKVYQELALHNPLMAEAWTTLKTALEQPELPGQTLIHGRSLRYWREIATMAHDENLIKLSIPVLIAAGGQDPVMPAGTKSYLAELNQQSQGRIQIRWFARANHGLSHPERAYLPDFMFLLERWLMQEKQVFSDSFLAVE